ncbi:acyl-CoA thioesterase [Crenalkalicoccus roseus]|uniref:acyl-CoA thioesterase n=1 Tax=Crenalkalicoccus roseus TaxID=1485588 RepID=UPI001080981F|nr:thioesterase family protein [Crenalkalicoccus roseus]
MSGKMIGTRADYRWFVTMDTRWMDNDVYRHVNNVQYYSFFDTAVARFLLEAGMFGEGTLDLDSVPSVGLVVETQCRYHAPLAFPDRVAVGLRLGRLGTSSVRYEIGVFRNEEDRACAEGHFVHVYVDRREQSRTVPVPGRLREALARHLQG